MRHPSPWRYKRLCGFYLIEFVANQQSNQNLCINGAHASYGCISESLLLRLPGRCEMALRDHQFHVDGAVERAAPVLAFGRRVRSCLTAVEVAIDRQGDSCISRWIGGIAVRQSPSQTSGRYFIQSFPPDLSAGCAVQSRIVPSAQRPCIWISLT
jgi:hypothetical protein